MLPSFYRVKLAHAKIIFMNPLSTDEDNDGKRKYTKFEVRPYKMAELASIYGVNIDTFKSWIKNLRFKIGKVTGHYLTILQVEIIIAHLKLPYFIIVEALSEEEYEQRLEEKMRRLSDHPHQSISEHDPSDAAQKTNPTISKKGAQKKKKKK